MENRTQIIILAGGQGKRMSSELPKVLVPLFGQPIIKYLLKSIKESGVCKRPTIVVGFKADLVKESLGSDYDYVMQTEQLGTGHAVACCKAELEKRAENILVLYGDHPNVSAGTIQKVVDAHLESGTVLTMATAKVDDYNDWRIPFYHFGRVIRDEAGKIKEIVELKDCTEEQKNITEVNPSYFCFRADWLWENIDKLENNNAQAEYYLTDLAGMAIEQGEEVKTVFIEPREALGINNKEHLQAISDLI